VKKIANFVEIDDVDAFRLLFVSKQEIRNMRFGYNMNLLQLVCFEEAVKILDFIRR
jgi:hypothetical protein